MSVLLALLIAAPLRVGVFCPSRSELCEKVIPDLTVKIASDKLAVIPQGELASRLAVVGSAETISYEDACAAGSRALVDEAETAYYHAQFDEAASKLELAAVIQSRNEISLGDRARMLVLRAALEVKKGDYDSAVGDTHDALQEDPGYDASSFPPALQKLVEAERSKLPALAVLNLTVTPPDAQVWVDGRPAKPGLKVVTGRKGRIEARAPGYVTLFKPFDAPRGAKTVSLSASLWASTPKLPAVGVTTWLEQGAPPTAAHPLLAGLAKKVSADLLVLLMPELGNRVQAVVYSRGKTSASEVYPEKSLDQLPGWVQAHLLPPP